MNAKTIAAVSLLSAVALAPQGRAGECPIDYTLSPALLGSDGDFSIGLDYSLLYSNEWFDQFASGNYDGYFEVKLEGELALDADLARKPLVNQIRGGFSRHWMTMPPGPPPGAGGVPAQGAAKMDDRGVFAAGFALRHEADQELNQQDIVGGAELSYINIRDEGIWSFIPSVVAAFDLVRAIDEPHSRHADGDPDKDHSRLRIEASLKSSFGKQVFEPGSFWEPLGLRVDVRHHELFGADNTLDESVTYGAVALTYTLKEQGGHWKHTTLFIRLSDGRIPPAEKDETVIAIGATNPW